MGVDGWSVVFQGERQQADLLLAVLEANGLRAEVLSDTAYSYAMNFTEARVLVPDDQVEAAKRLIEAASQPAPEPPPTEV